MMEHGDAAEQSADNELAQRIATLLESLGGHTALSASRVAPAAARRLPVVPAQSAHPDGDEHDDDHHHHAPPGASATERVTIRADDELPAASLAKIPIAIELLRRADLGQFDLTEPFDTSREPRVGGGGVLDYLDPSVQLTLRDLCFLMLGVSDNTASNFLLDLVGMGEINETISRLNLAHTKLARHFMDWEARAAHRENVTSAADMVTLLALIRGNALPGASVLRDILAAQQRADDLQAWLPQGATLAHKTGELEDVFHDAGILTGPSGTCVFGVLTASQADIPPARAVVGRILRLLWDAWCAA